MNKRGCSTSSIEVPSIRMKFKNLSGTHLICQRYFKLYILQNEALSGKILFHIIHLFPQNNFPVISVRCRFNQIQIQFDKLSNNLIQFITKLYEQNFILPFFDSFFHVESSPHHSKYCKKFLLLDCSVIRVNSIFLILTREIRMQNLHRAEL